MESPHRRHHPLTWPVVIALTVVCFFAFVILVPAEWINLFFSPLAIKEVSQKKTAENWLEILPPPMVEAIDDSRVPPAKKDLPKQPPPPADDPGWWTSAWQVKTNTDARSQLAPVSRDSIAVLLETLGVGLDFTRKALPDSLLNHHLMLLRIEEGFDFEKLKPYISALTKARALADKNSREAAMFDDHLRSTIMVPD